MNSGAPQPEQAVLSLMVTGAAGFLGSHVVDALLVAFEQEQFGDIRRIVAVDSLEYCSTMRNIEHHQQKKNFVFECADIRDIDAMRRIFKAYNVAMVFHLAHVDSISSSCSGNPLLFTDVNIRGTHVLLEVAREFAAENTFEQFLYVGSEKPDETRKDCLTPTNPYSVSKAAAEMLVQSYYDLYGLPVRIVRPCNIYGPRQYPQKVIAKFIVCLQNGLLPRIEGSGSQERAFLYVSDATTAIVEVALRGSNGMAYNIGCKNRVSVLELAKRLTNMIRPESVADKDIFQHDADKPGNDRHYRQTQEELGWNPTVSFEAGLQKTIEWFNSIDKKTYWDELQAAILADDNALTNKEEPKVNSTVCAININDKDISKNKQSRCIAVCIHLWDSSEQQIIEMLARVENVVTASHSNSSTKQALGPVGFVVVTVSTLQNSSEKQNEIKRRFLNVAKDAVVEILPVQNRGFDLGGFLVACGYLLDSEQLPTRKTITLVLKLHTKSQLRFRTTMTAPLCGTPKAVEHCLTTFVNDEKIGQIGANRYVMVDCQRLCETNKHHLTDMFKMLNLDAARLPEPSRAKFVAGTMFWIRWSILQTLFTKHIRPCTLRKLCNDDACLDYHWYRLPNGRTTLGANHGKTLISCEESVRHFESVGERQNNPGSIIHASFDKLKVPWDGRFRDGQIEHALERFFGYWVMYSGYQTIGV